MFVDNASKYNNNHNITYEKTTKYENIIKKKIKLFPSASKFIMTIQNTFTVWPRPWVLLCLVWLAFFFFLRFLFVLFAKTIEIPVQHTVQCEISQRNESVTEFFNTCKFCICISCVFGDLWRLFSLQLVRKIDFWGKLKALFN